MEKETILSELKTRLGTTSLSERTLSEYAGNILPSITDDAQVNDTFYQAHIGILKSLEGQLNKDVADRVKIAQSEFEKKQQKHIEPPKPPVVEKPNDELAEMKAMIAAMQKRIEEQDKATQAKATLESVKAAMKAKGATDEAVMLFTFKGETIDSTKSVDELTESYLQTYDTNYKTLRGDGAVPRSAFSSQQKNEDKFLDDYFAKKVAEGKFPEQK